MTLTMYVHILCGACAGGFMLLFSVASRREKRVRAMVISGATALLVVAAWTAWALLFAGEPWLGLPTGLVLVTAALFFAPIGRRRGIAPIPGADVERVDERDVVFSREEYHPGEHKYEEYYACRPELRERDDRFRRLPELLEPGSRLYDPEVTGRTADLFRSIEDLTTEVDGTVADEAEDLDAAAATEWVRRTVLELGADEVGIARLDPAWVYSHVGRGPEPWGGAITMRHRYAVVFAIEMDYEAVEQAPWPPITHESASCYLKASRLSTTLARRIREKGRPARAHVAGSNYQIILPPVARDAGLGELGRFGYLVSRGLGARCRLGAVTTDLPLIPDRPVDLGVREFCELCKRCADNCPSGSIPKGEMTEVRGVAKWPLEVESCLQYWRFLGTDCGICMKVCPYAHPRSFVHQVIRFGIERSAFARRVALLGEDLFYGRHVKLPRHSHHDVGSTDGPGG